MLIKESDSIEDDIDPKPKTPSCVRPRFKKKEVILKKLTTEQ